MALGFRLRGSHALGVDLNNGGTSDDVLVGEVG